MAEPVVVITRSACGRTSAHTASATSLSSVSTKSDEKSPMLSEPIQLKRSASVRFAIEREMKPSGMETQDSSRAMTPTATPTAPTGRSPRTRAPI